MLQRSALGVVAAGMCLTLGAIGGSALYLTSHGPCELWTHSDPRRLVVVRWSVDCLVLYAIDTAAGGLGRDEVIVRCAGFSYERSAYIAGGRSHEIAVPRWACATALAAPGPLTFLWCGKRRRRQSDQTDCCRSCGYDLRATPNRCPECGAVPAETAGANVAAALLAPRLLRDRRLCERPPPATRSR